MNPCCVLSCSWIENVWSAQLKYGHTWVRGHKLCFSRVKIVRGLYPVAIAALTPLYYITFTHGDVFLCPLLCLPQTADTTSIRSAGDISLHEVLQSCFRPLPIVSIRAGVRVFIEFCSLPLAHSQWACIKISNGVPWCGLVFATIHVITSKVCERTRREWDCNKFDHVMTYCKSYG